MKSKKRRIAVPLIAIAVSLCLIIVVTVFTTPVVYMAYSAYYRYGDEVEAPDTFFFTKKAGKISEIVYRIHPSYDNLAIVYGCYDIGNYIIGAYNGEEIPEGYLEKSLKYAQLMSELTYEDICTSKFVAVPLVDQYYDKDKSLKLIYSVDYINALYISGKIDEAKRVAEESVAILTSGAIQHIYYNNIKEAFYYIYATAGDEGLKQWVLEQEAKIDEFCKNEPKMTTYYETHDSVFTNPDLAVYISGRWPEHIEAEQNLARQGIVTYDVSG